MKSYFKTALLAAGMSVGAAALPVVASPAFAQVSGIATSDPVMVVLRSKARDAAYRQINQTYSAQVGQIQQMQTELTGIQKSLDTNGDREVNQQEYDAKPAVVKQMEAKQKQMNDTMRPMLLAQHYAIQQVIDAYEAARNQVISSKKIAIMLQPDAIQYAPDAVDVTSAIVAALDSRLPTVSTAVPANWQPRRETAQTHQAMQQLMMLAAAQQQSAGQTNAAPAPAASGR